jgi:hypothetical protein
MNFKSLRLVDYGTRGFAGNADVFSESFTSAVAEASATAVAKAIATALSSASGCSVEATAAACAGCVKRDEKCAGYGLPEVLGCCDPNDVCVRRNWYRSDCKSKTWQVPSYWDGTLETC